MKTLFNCLKSLQKSNIFQNMPKFFRELMQCREIFSFVIEKVVLYFLHLYLHHYLLNKRISFELAVLFELTVINHTYDVFFK